MHLASAVLRIWLAAPRHGWQLAGFIFGALAVGVLTLILLCSVPPRYRKWVVAGVTFVAGLYYSLEFLVPPLRYFHQTNPLSDWRPFVGTAAQIVGVSLFCWGYPTFSNCTVMQ